MTGGSGVRRYRRRWLAVTWVGVFGAVPVVSGSVGMAFGLGLLGRSAGADVPEVIVFGMWALVGVAAGIRSAMVAVTATPEHLVIRNFWTTRRAPWAQIRKIDRPRPFLHVGRPSGFANLDNGLRVRLVDGRTLVATAYTPAGWDSAGFADAVVGELNREVERRRKSAKTASRR